MPEEEFRRSFLERVFERVFIYGIRPLILVILIFLTGVLIIIKELMSADLFGAMIGIIIIAIGIILGIGFAATTVRRRRPSYRLPQYMIGLVGEARTEIKSGGEGVIWLESELWSAVSDSSEDIKVGDKVLVTGYDGLKLRVKPQRTERNSNSKSQT